jgi:hypothetical protein
MRTKKRISADSAMRTTLELSDAVFARLKARAAHEQMTLKQLLRCPPDCTPMPIWPHWRSAMAGGW